MYKKITVQSNSVKMVYIYITIQIVPKQLNGKKVACKVLGTQTYITFFFVDFPSEKKSLTN